MVLHWASFFFGRRQTRLLEVTNSGRVAAVLCVCAQTLHSSFGSTSTSLLAHRWLTCPSTDLRWENQCHHGNGNAVRQMRSYGIHATQSMATPRTIRICFAYYTEAVGSILDERPNKKTKTKKGKGLGLFARRQLRLQWMWWLLCWIKMSIETQEGNSLDKMVAEVTS